MNSVPAAKIMSPCNQPPSSGKPAPINPSTPTLVCNNASSLHLSSADNNPGVSHVAAGIGSSAICVVP